MALLSIMMSAVLWLQAQGEMINKNFPIAGIDKVSFNFTWSDVIFEPSTSNQVEVSASVEINGGADNDHFELSSKSSNGTLYITSDVTNMDKIQKIITLKHKGQKYRIKKDKDYKKNIKELKEELGVKDFNTYNSGVDIEITITIKLPKVVSLEVESTYGRLDFNEVHNPMNIDNTYGGVNITFDPSEKIQEAQINATYAYVDVSVPDNTNVDIDLKTSYGKLFTDMDIDIDTNKSNQKAFSNHVVGKLNAGGPELRMKSDYGKVYLRALK